MILLFMLKLSDRKEIDFELVDVVARDVLFQQATSSRRNRAIRSSTPGSRPVETAKVVELNS